MKYILKLVEGIDMFRGLRLGQAGEILQIAKRSSFSAGTEIFKGTFTRKLQKIVILFS